MVRALVRADRPVIQRDLAEQCQTSQPRVSQVLSLLAEDDLVRRVSDGWVARRSALVDGYLGRFRPRETHAETWWYALDGLLEQARRIVDIAPRSVVSADLATDLSVPWRRPSTMIVWVRHPLELSSLGFVTAESRSSSTVILRTTDDDRMLADAEVVDDLPLAPRLQQAADLLDLGGSDRTEASEMLLADLRAVR